MPANTKDMSDLLKYYTVLLLLLSVSGPILFFVATRLMGASVLDGLFGVYKNTPFQDLMLGASYLLTILGFFGGFIFGVVKAVKYGKLNRGFIMLPLYACIPMIAIVLLFASM